MVEARWHGALIAQSDDTVVVEPEAAQIRDRIAFWRGVELR